MKIVVNNSALLLDRWQTVELVDAAGTTATLDRGCVWITMDGDRRDVVLGAGQSFTVDRNGKTLLHAEVPSTLRIAPAPVHNALTALAGFIGGAWERARASIDAWATRSLDVPRKVPYY